jgi:hypothetical protein
MEIFKRGARGAVETQSGTGLWHQLLDRTDSYLETSASAMFTFAIARGVNRGWLPVYYAPVAQTGWRAIEQRVRPDGQIEGICVGTTAAYDAVYYYHRPTALNAMQGYGPTLMAGPRSSRCSAADVRRMNNTFYYAPKQKSRGVPTTRIATSATAVLADPSAGRSAGGGVVTARNPIDRARPSEHRVPGCRHRRSGRRHPHGSRHGPGDREGDLAQAVDSRRREARPLVFQADFGRGRAWSRPDGGRRLGATRSVQGVRRFVRERRATRLGERPDRLSRWRRARDLAQEPLTSSGVDIW